MGKLTHFIKREMLDRLTSMRERRQEFIRKNRVMRELRLERRQTKWLRDRGNRAFKRSEGKYVGTEELEKVLPEREGGPEQDPSVFEKMDEMLKKAKWKHPWHPVSKLEGSAAASTPGFEPGNEGSSPSPPATAVKDMAPGASGAQRSLWKLLGQAMKPRHLTALEVQRIPRGGMSPAARGGFTPTPTEYAKEVIPSYIETDEELERHLELKQAEKLYADAEKKRAKRVGPALCQEVPLNRKGHAWFKKPGQPEWCCMECGRKVPTTAFDLSDGTMVDIRGAQFYNRNALLGLNEWAAKHKELLGPQAKTVGELRAQVRELLGQNGSSTALAVPDELADLPSQILVIPKEAEYEELEGEYEVCRHCGMAKGSHFAEQIPVYHDEGTEGHKEAVARRGTALKAHVSKLWCPKHGVDAT